MSNKRYEHIGLLAVSAALLSSVLSAPMAYAASWSTAWLKISVVQANTGFFRMTPNVPMQNPDGCSDADGYIVDYAQAGSDKFLAMALSAQATGFQVQLVVDGCYLNRPKVIGINIKP